MTALVEIRPGNMVDTISEYPGTKAEQPPLSKTVEGTITSEDQETLHRTINELMDVVNTDQFRERENRLPASETLLRPNGKTHTVSWDIHTSSVPSQEQGKEIGIEVLRRDHDSRAYSVSVREYPTGSMDHQWKGVFSVSSLPALTPEEKQQGDTVIRYRLDGQPPLPTSTQSIEALTQKVQYFKKAVTQALPPTPKP